MIIAQRHWSIPPKRRFVAVVVLVLVTNSLTAWVLLERSRWEQMQWEGEVSSMAGYAAALQAHADFRNGVLRQYQLTEDGRAAFTGRHDGPFEVWSWT